MASAAPRLKCDCIFSDMPCTAAFLAEHIAVGGIAEPALFHVRKIHEADEFTNIASKLHPGITLSAAYAIENEAQNARFEATKREIGILRGTLSPTCGIAYHGTRGNLWSIGQGGLQLNGAKFGMFGMGIYTTPESEKAVLYTNGRGVPDSDRVLLVTEVILGASKNIDVGMPATTLRQAPVGFDSVIGEGDGHHTEWVVYRSEQVRVLYALICRVTDPALDIPKQAPPPAVAARNLIYIPLHFIKFFDELKAIARAKGGHATLRTVEQEIGFLFHGLSTPEIFIQNMEQVLGMPAPPNLARKIHKYFADFKLGYGFFYCC